MYKARVSIFMSIGFALVWSILYIQLMSSCAEFIARCSIVLIQCGLCGATIFSYILWEDAKKQVEYLKKQVKYETLNEAQQLQFDKLEGGAPTRFLITMLCFGFVSLLFFCLVCCCAKDLQRAVDVIDASADFIANNKRVIFVPNLHFFITLAVTVSWYGAFLCVISLN